MAYKQPRYNKPFQVRAPDFRQVRYEFTYATPSDALAAYNLIRDKRYTLLENGDYVRPVGHRIRAREEAVAGEKLTFLGQVVASSLPTNPELQAMELEIAGAQGSMTDKVILS